MECPSCHSDNRDGAKFCNECGAPLTVDGPSKTVEDLDAEGKTRVVRPDT